MPGNRKLIIYAGAFRFPDGNAAAHRARSNAKLLREADYDVILVGVGNSLPADYRIDGFRCANVPAPKSIVGWLAYSVGDDSLLRMIHAHRRELAFVICYNYPAAAIARIAFAGQRSGFRVVADATEWYRADGGSLLFRVVKWLDTSARMRLVHRLLPALITTSPVLSNYYARGSLPILELPTLFDSEQLPPPVFQPGETCRFVYAGHAFVASRLNRRRSNVKDRLDLALVAFGRLAESRYSFVFDVFGMTSEDYLAAFPEHRVLVEQLGARVRFHGQQPHSAVLQGIRSADFAVFFRDSDRAVLAGFPTKLAEAVSLGTPVITSDLVNLSSLQECDFILRVPRGQELSAIERVLRMTVAERHSLKLKAFDSKLFDYRSFRRATADFVRRFREKVS